MSITVERETEPVYAIVLTAEERAALVRVLLCVQDNWTLDPTEDLLLARLEALGEGLRDRPARGA